MGYVYHVCVHMYVCGCIYMQTTLIDITTACVYVCAHILSMCAHVCVGIMYRIFVYELYRYVVL